MSLEFISCYLLASIAAHQQEYTVLSTTILQTGIIVTMTIFILGLYPVPKEKLEETPKFRSGQTPEERQFAYEKRQKKRRKNFDTEFIHLDFSGLSGEPKRFGPVHGLDKKPDNDLDKELKQFVHRKFDPDYGLEEHKKQLAEHEKSMEEHSPLDLSDILKRNDELNKMLLETDLISNTDELTKRYSSEQPVEEPVE